MDIYGHDQRVTRALATNGAVYQLVRLTPELAAHLLAYHNIGNRIVREPQVRKFIDLISREEWYPEAGVFMFSPNGNMMNGQHRCVAVVKTRRAVMARMAFNVDESTRDYVDVLLAKRGVADIVRYSEPDVHVSAIEAAAARRAYLRGYRRRQPVDLTPKEGADIVRLYRERTAHVYSLTMSTARDLLASAGVSVLLRATFTVDDECIRTFGHIMVEGGGSGCETTIVRLRDWCYAHRGRWRGGETDIECYQKTERALAAYVAGVQLKILYASAVELFPVPAEYECQSMFGEPPETLKAPKRIGGLLHDAQEAR
jgi:hypothetical protein